MTTSFPKGLKRDHYFVSPIWECHHGDEKYINKIDKASDKYIKEAKKLTRNENVFHSKSLINVPQYRELQDYIVATSHNLLLEMGYDLKTVRVFCTEMWVQEFDRKGGGHHSLHTHWNGHISGFYFLKGSDKTSKPVFHDPRAGAMMNQLPEINFTELHIASSQIEFKPRPGKIIFFPSYLPHEYTVDAGKEPFRFIHFNCQALPVALENIVK